MIDRRKYGFGRGRRPAKSTGAPDAAHQRAAARVEARALEEEVKTINQLKAGASWFFWIAGLSLLNSVVIISKGSWAFLIGLGVTQFATALATQGGSVAQYIAFAFTAVATGIFILFGVFARMRHGWAFISGMILYGLDGLLFLLVPDWLSIGFHVFALVCISQGLAAHWKLSKLERENQAARLEAGAAIAEVSPVSHTIVEPEVDPGGKEPKNLGPTNRELQKSS